MKEELGLGRTAPGAIGPEEEPGLGLTAPGARLEPDLELRPGLGPELGPDLGPEPGPGLGPPGGAKGWAKATPRELKEKRPTSKETSIFFAEFLVVIVKPLSPIC